MTDQPQEAARSAGGGKADRGDPRTLKARNRAIRREELIEQLRNAKLVEHVIESANKLADETRELDPVMVGRMKAANDARLALIRKYLPDLKAVEMTGEDGGPVVVEAITRKIIDPRGS